MAKKRLVKNYDALSEEIIQDLKAKYPNGYEQHLVKYTDKDGKFVSALPFETEDVYYLIRMTVQEAKRFDAADFEEEDTPIRSDMDDLEVGNEFDGQGEEDDDLMDNGDEETDHIIVTRRRNSSDDMDDIADDSDY